MDSRDINELDPIVKEKCLKLIDLCKEKGIKLIVTSTYRSIEFQNNLYAQGRTKPGKRITNARGGFSYHNFRLAFDVVPVENQNGKQVAIWNNNNYWKTIGAIGKSLDLTWGGDFKTITDYPHFQYDKKSLADLRAGK